MVHLIADAVEDGYLNKKHGNVRTSENVVFTDGLWIEKQGHIVTQIAIGCEYIRKNKCGVCIEFNDVLNKNESGRNKALVTVSSA